MNQRVTLELYQKCKTGWRRIAALPDCTDELSDAIKSTYCNNPKFNVRLVTELF